MAETGREVRADAVTASSVVPDAAGQHDAAQTIVMTTHVITQQLPEKRRTNADSTGRVITCGCVEKELELIGGEGVIVELEFVNVAYQ